MTTWSDETTIEIITHIHFYLRCFKYINLGKYDNYNLIEIQENEFRRDNMNEPLFTLYYSQITKYRLLGYLLPNKEHSLSDYFLCTSCFQKINNMDICNNCYTDFTKHDFPFFLNCSYFTQYTLYDKYKQKYDLGIFEKFSRDQRISMCNPMKKEIVKVAMHPNKIQRILDLTNDLENLENYI